MFNVLILAALSVVPVYTNHNRIAGNVQTMTNIQAWAEAVETAIGQGGINTNGVQSIIQRNIDTNLLFTVAAAQDMTKYCLKTNESGYIQYQGDGLKFDGVVDMENAALNFTGGGSQISFDDGGSYLSLSLYGGFRIASNQGVYPDFIVDVYPRYNLSNWGITNAYTKSEIDGTSVTNGGAVASANEYADATFLPLSGGRLDENVNLYFGPSDFSYYIGSNGDALFHDVFIEGPMGLTAGYINIGFQMTDNPWDSIRLTSAYDSQTLPAYLASTTWHGSNKSLEDYGITNGIPSTNGLITAQTATNIAEVIIGSIVNTNTVVIGLDASVTNVAAGYTMPTNHSVAIGALARTTLPTTTSRTSARQIDSRAVAIGYNAEASGTYGAAQAVAIGPNTKASGAASVALGGGSSYYDDSGVITNTSATEATGDFGLAIGYLAKAKGNYSTALGYKTTTEGVNTIAIGGNKTLARNDSTAVGFDSIATDSAVSIGKASQSGSFSVAIGNSASSTNLNSVAIGSSAATESVRSLAIGSGAKTERNDGIAIGTSSSARKPYATALGYGADAKPDYAILIGTLSYAESNATHSIGIGNEAIVSNKNALAIGERANAVGENDIVIGYNAKSSGSSIRGNAIAIGNGADAKSVHNVSIGLGAISRAPGSISIGNNFGGGGATDSAGYYAISLGNGAKASQESSVAIGTKSVNNKAKSIQLGEGTTKSANSLQFRSVEIVKEIADNRGQLNNGLEFSNYSGETLQLKDLSSASDITNAAKQVFIENADYALTNLTANTETFALASGVIGNLALDSSHTNINLTLLYPASNTKSADILLRVINAADAALAINSADTDVDGTDWTKVKAGTNYVSATRTAYEGGRSKVLVNVKGL